MPDTLSSVLEVVGIACIAIAGFLVFLPLGLFLAGVGLVLIGYLGGSDVTPPTS